ncbi:MAG: hypothetical protein QG657_234 [Acidobacteriota bacterium]|nr:hypothetical protein [Acidobacteriota bacterium]
MKYIYILLVLVIVPFVSTCHKEADQIKITQQVLFKELNEKSVEIIDTTVEDGYPCGVSFEKGEVYVHATLPVDRKYEIKIIDIDSKKTKRSVYLPMGDFQAPGSFFNPSYIEYLNHRYYIIDQFHKIIAYNENFEYLYTSMFQELRRSMDFFSQNNQLFFLIGTMMPARKVTLTRVELYRLEDNKRPEHVRRLDESLFYLSTFKDYENRKFRHVGALWAGVRVFAKDGNLFYAKNTEDRIYRQDVLTGKTDAIGLSFLRPKTFSDKQANTFRYSHSSGWQEDFFKKDGIRIVYEAYPEPLFHFGLYDVGVNKIGIIGDLDIVQLTFRLDIIDSGKMEYIESIRLPFGSGLMENIASNARGLLQTYIDIDKGVYVWFSEGDEPENRVNITFFRIK